MKRPRTTSATRAFAVLLAAFVVSSPTPAAAQQGPGASGTVTGTVVAEDAGTPLEGAGVALLAPADSSRVAEAVTDGRGRFVMAEVPPGRHLLRIERLGYGGAGFTDVTVRAGETTSLGRILLAVEALDVGGVVVTAEQPAVSFETDRTTYHVGRMPEVAGGTVSDILESIPELEVDIDGRITVRGATPEVYLDGRPAPMSGEALVLFLEQFSADHVDRVEVLENPSARYRAEGSGGIVNIELEEGVELGVSGSVYANAGTRGRAGVGARGTLQHGDWTLDAGLSAGLSDREASSYDLRQNLVTDPTTFLRRESLSDRDGTDGRVDLDVEYRPGERLRLWTEARVDGDDDASERFSTTTHMDQHQDPTLRYDRTADGDSRAFSGRAAAGVDYVWERRTHELEIELRHDRERDREASFEEYLEETLEDDAFDDELVPAEHTEEREEDADRETTLSVDYTRPLGEDARLETGYELVDERTEQLRRLHETEEPLRKHGFAHERLFHSAYLDLRRSFGDLGVQAGVRMEREDGRLTLPDGRSFGDEDVRFFPSASVSYRLDRGRQLRLSYSQRIRRPSGRALDPTDRSTDPLEREVGNPDLGPELTRSVSLEGRWSGDFGYLRLSPYLRRTEGQRERVTTVDGDGVATRTWENVASTETLGASLTLGLPRSSRIGGRVSLSGRREVRNADNLAVRYSGSSFRWSSRLSLRGRVTEALSATSRFRYSSGRAGLQGRTSGQLTGDVGLRYRFLDDRASIRLSLRDPFGLRSSTGRARDPTYVQLERSTESTRSARINLSYSFGGEGRRRR